MRIYQAAAANVTQPVSKVYPAAAKQMNSICGPSYVNTTVPTLPDSSASTVLKLGLVTPLIMLLTLFRALFI